MTGSDCWPRTRSQAAYAERWIGTARRECLDRLLIFTERQLRTVLAEYETHYNSHRPHRSGDPRPPAGTTEPAVPTEQVGMHRTDLLGGLIHEYRHVA